MARQPRPGPQPPTDSRAAARGRTSRRKSPAPGPAPSDDAARSSFVAALAHYEQAMRALQEHRFPAAADSLRAILAEFPEEKELNDRARLYLAVCERHLRPPAPEPGTAHDRLLAATLAINAGDGARAIRLLDTICQEDPGHDQALYLMAVAYGLAGDPSSAAPFLQRAIEVNAGNRVRARVDPDLEPLRGEEAIMALLERPAGDRPLDGRVRQDRS